MKNSERKALSVFLAGLLLMASLGVKAQSSSGGSATLYGSMISSFGDYFNGTPGVYKFNPYDVSTFSSVAPNIKVYGGGTYANGTYYAINYEESGTFIKLPSTLTLYDTKNSWTVKTTYRGGSAESLASDLTFDPVTGNIYGVFYDANYSSCLRFGTLELDNPIEGAYTSKLIAELPERMVGIAANQKGVIYAIGVSGNLYTIDKQTGNATVVGSTGVSEVSPFFQSACCNMQTGTIYWSSCYGSYGDFGIYEVNPTSGAANLIGDLGYYGTDTQDQLTGITTLEDVERPVFVNGVTNLAVSFDKNSLTGKVTFTLPTQNSKAETLAGDVNYQVSIDGTVAKQGKGAAGADVSVDVATTAGKHVFSVVATQEGIDGDARTLNKWVGDDYPKAPAGLKANVAKKDDRGANIRVKWNTVRQGLHDGYVDATKVAYNLVRMPDSVQVYAGSDTTYTDRVETDETRHYTYRLWATHQTLSSDTIVSNEVTVSGAHVPPYTDDFTDEVKFAEWTIVDNNGDGSTWQRQDGHLAYNYNSSNAADDYAISPAMKLKAGNLYYVSFVATNSYPTEKVALYAGSTPSAEGMTTQLIAPVDITYQPRQHSLLAAFRPEADGIYYFGIKACSEADRSTLFVEDFAVEAVPASAPAKPENLVVAPDSKGGMSATVSFTAPTKTIGGDALTAIDAVVVERDGEQVFTSSGTVAPGENITVSDDGVATSSLPSEGLHIYKVYCKASSLQGDFASQQAFVGIDVPAAVEQLKAVEDLNNPGTIRVSWQAPAKGQNGGYINPESLSYVISVGTSGSNVTTSETTYTDHLDISKGQAYQGYSVYAVNSAGSGRNVWKTVTAIAGPAIEAPMVESFPNTTMKSGPWLPEMTEGEIGDAYWTPCDGIGKFSGTEDGDLGVVVFDAAKLDVASMIQSPKIDISKLKSPRLTLWIYNTGKEDEAEVSISADYGDYEPLKDLYLDKDPGWERVVCDLSQWKNSHFVRIGITAKAVASTTDIFAFDNFAIGEAAAADLGATSLEVLPKVTAGQSTKLLLKARNWGDARVSGSDYKVELYKNGRLANTFDGSDIDVDMTASLALTDTLSVVDDVNTTYYAKIAYPADQYAANDQSNTASTEVVKNDFPAPTAVKAMKNGQDVTVEWTAPDLSQAPLHRTTDSFEDYEPFAISNVGNWTMVDGDNTATIRITLTGMTSPLDYPNAGAKMAFQVFNTEESGIPFSSWDPHTGSQMLAAFKCASPDQGQTEVANNDWLISPELSGTAQTISFYAKTGMGGVYTPEEFEILYSTTTADTAAFVKIGTTHQLTNAKTWLEIREELPEGARWFAIRCVSENKFAMLLDDVTYTAKDAPQEDLTLTGYRVYRDNTCVGQVTGNDLTFVDHAPELSSNSRYQVSALFDKGESPLSEAAGVVTSVGGIATSQASISGSKGTISLAGLDGKRAEVLTVGGQRVATVSNLDNTTLSVAPGVYLVTLQGQATVKVVVR